MPRTSVPKRCGGLKKYDQASCLTFTAAMCEKGEFADSKRRGASLAQHIVVAPGVIA